MVGNWDLKVNYLDTSKAPKTLTTQAMFNSATNQTVYQGWSAESGTDDGKFDLPMWEISYIEFTPAA